MAHYFIKRSIGILRKQLCILKFIQKCPGEIEGVAASNPTSRGFQDMASKTESSLSNNYGMTDDEISVLFSGKTLAELEKEKAEALAALPKYSRYKGSGTQGGSKEDDILQPGMKWEISSTGIRKQVPDPGYRKTVNTRDVDGFGKKFRK